MLASTIISLIFKLFERFGVRNLPAIVVNYFVCVLCGTLFEGAWLVDGDTFSAPWIWLAFGLGFFFIGGFNLNALSVQRAGIAVTSVVQRISLLLSVGFAVLYLGDPIGHLQLIGIALGVVSVFLVVLGKSAVAGLSPKPATAAPDHGLSPKPATTSLYHKLSPKPATAILDYGLSPKPATAALDHELSPEPTTAALDEELSPKPATAASWILPLAVFVVAGTIESGLTLAQRRFDAGSSAAYTVTLFLWAGLLGLAAALFGPAPKDGPRFTLRDVVGGIALGIPNFFSIHLILVALQEGLPPAVVFPVLNVATIVLGTILAVTLFGERLSDKQWVGMALAVVAIVLITI